MGRSLFRMLALGTVLAGIIALPGTGGGGSSAFAATPQAEPRVQITAHVGFDGRASLNRWAPLNVEVSNQGSSVRGEIVARQARGMGGPVAEYVLPLDLPEGARKRVHLDVPAQSGARTVDVVYVSGGKELAVTTVALQVGGPDDLLVGVLSREPLALSALSQVKLAGRAGNLRLVRLHAETFPENITLLQNFDVLAVARFDTSRLSQAQSHTLTAWVRRGGMLVLVGGPEWRTTLTGLPPELVPVRIDGTRSLSELPVLAALGGAELPTRGRPFVLTTGTMKDGRAVAVEGTDPVVAVGRLGQGTILYFGVDLTMEPFSSWTGAMTMWETLLLQYRAADFWSTGNTTAGNPALMARALSTQPLLTAPDLKQLAKWFIGYLFIIGPIGYGLLELIRRRGLIWLLVPATAAGALALFYYQGFVVDHRAIMTRSVSVTEATPGMATVASRTYLAVVAPSLNELKVELSPGDLAAPLAFPERAGAGEVTRMTMVNPPATEIKGMNMWSLRGVMVDREVQGLEGLKFDLGIRGSRLGGTVTNGTEHLIRDAVLITPTGHEALPDLKSGDAITLDTALGGFQRRWQPVFQDIFSGSSNIKDANEQTFRRLILEAAVGATRDTLPSPIMFLGWLSQSPAPLATAGQHVAGTHLIYSSVQPSVDPKDYDLPPGLIMGKLVAAEGQQRGRSPRGYFLQEGALTFSLQVPDIDRTVLRELSVQVETGGPPGTSQVKLLNWRTGKWDALGNVKAAENLAVWNQYLAADGSMLVRVEVETEGQEIRAPTISLRGR